MASYTVTEANRVPIEAPVKDLSGAFERAGFPLYAVGGQVRNALLGLPIGDLDVCAALPPARLPALLEGTGVRIVPIAPEFGSVQLHANGVMMEYTTFRSDTYGSDGKHRPQGVRFSQTVEEDAFRRDFTVNAIYARAATGEITDPTGGIADLEKRVLRCTTENPDRILQDDGLRTLRLVRFAAELGFGVEPASYESARKHASLLEDIPVERIWQELRKCLLADVRYRKDERERPFRTEGHSLGDPAHLRALRLMVELGMMRYVLPELLEGEGVKQGERYHAYTVLDHNLMSCAWSAPILSVRLASLLHDVGKPRCLAATGRMLGHDLLGADMSRDMLGRLRVERTLTERVADLVRIHMYDLNSGAKLKTVQKRFARLGRVLSREFVLVREADFLGSGRLDPPVASAMRLQDILDDMIAQGAPFAPSDLRITGQEIMEVCDIKPGPKVGVIKEKLFLHCAANSGDNENAKLRAMAKRLAASIMENNGRL